MSLSRTCKQTSGRGVLYFAATILLGWALGCNFGSSPASQSNGDVDDEQATGAVADDATNDAGENAASTVSTCGHAIDGERLEVIRLIGDDGSWEATGWYDTLFELRCYFVQATDGVDRCVPLDQVVSTSPLRYLDAQCTQPIAVSPGDECVSRGPPRFLLLTERIDACPSEARRPFELGDRLGAPDTVYALLEDGSCVAEQSLNPDGTVPDVYEVLDEVRPEDMVSARYEARGERMQDSYLVASDGASVRVKGPYDTANNSYCRVGLDDEGTWRCLPDVTAGVSFTDAECTQPVVEAHTRTSVSCSRSRDVFDGSNPFVVQRDHLGGDPGDCPFRTRVFQVDDLAPSEATALYWVDSLNANMCVGPTGTPVEVVAATVSPPESFSRASLEQGECDAAASSGTRLKRQNMVLEDGYRVSGLFFDSELGETCSVGMAADEVLRCLPGDTAVLGGVFFADSACTRAVAGVALPCPIGLDESQRVSPRYVQRSVAQAQCHSVKEIYELGPELSELYKLADSDDPYGDCVVADVTPWSSTVFKEILAPIPPSSFVRMTHSH